MRRLLIVLAFAFPFAAQAAELPFDGSSSLD